MRSLALVAAECQSISVSDGHGAGAAATIGAWQRIADRVWIGIAEPETVTIGLVAGDEGCLLVDCGSSAEHGRMIRDAIAAVTEVPLTAVVVTHDHYDHAHGLAAFDDLPTLGHESVRAALPDGVPGPRREIAVAAALDLGGRRVEIAHLGRGHTAGDLLVVVPDADVVFAGDLVESAGPPWWGADSYPLEWPTTLDGLVGLMADATRAIPGHGDPMDREAVFEARGRVGAVAGELQRLALAGVPETEALDRGEWPYPNEHIAAGIAPAYAQLAEQRPEVGRRRLPLA